MRVLAILTVLIQFTFAAHAVYTGRGARWVMIIMMAPVIGCLLYYFMEVFPQSREQRQLRRAVRDIGKALNPDGELKRRTEEASITASVDNRVALADECLEKGMFDEAIRLYEGCLEGPHAKDTRTLFALARARLYNGEHAAALDVLKRLEAADAKFRLEEVQLLHARVLDALGDTTGALALYEGLRDRYVGFEARFRHGLLLARLGRAREARELFQFIDKHARRSSVETEQEWVRLARAELARETATA